MRKFLIVTALLSAILMGLMVYSVKLINAKAATEENVQFQSQLAETKKEQLNRKKEELAQLLEEMETESEDQEWIRLQEEVQQMEAQKREMIENTPTEDHTQEKELLRSQAEQLTAEIQSLTALRDDTQLWLSDLNDPERMKIRIEELRTQYGTAVRQLEDMILAGESEYRICYLTFDDGPNKYNDAVLEILDRYGVKATFFTVGDFVSYYPQRVRNMVEAGHKIACHTNTHDFNTIYLSPEALVNDIKNWEANVEKALGYLPEEKIFRFPGGSNNYALPKADFPAFYQAVKEAGYTSFDWTCANNDRYLGGKPEDMPEVEYLKRSAIETVGSCSAYYPKIMLMHDTTSPTVEALPYIIETLQASGYTFATLDELDSDWLFRLSYN